MDELALEKARRVYYQDVVYAVCNSLDRVFGKRPGRGVVCGSHEHPSTQVQELLKEVETRCAAWAAARAANQTGEGPTDALDRPVV